MGNSKVIIEHDGYIVENIVREFKPKFPYFRLTRYAKGMGDLLGLFTHLCSLNIPCGIIMKRNKRTNDKEYALWRIGSEWTSDSGSIKGANSERIVGELVESFGGFDRVNEVLEAIA